MYVCMCVCMHVCMYVCVYVRTYVCMQFCDYVHVWLVYLSAAYHKYKCIHVEYEYIYISNIHTICTYIHIYIHIQTYNMTYAHTWVFPCCLLPIHLRALLHWLGSWNNGPTSDFGLDDRHRYWDDLHMTIKAHLLLGLGDRWHRLGNRQWLTYIHIYICEHIYYVHTTCVCMYNV